MQDRKKTGEAASRQRDPETAELIQSQQDQISQMERQITQLKVRTLEQMGSIQGLLSEVGGSIQGILSEVGKGSGCRHCCGTVVKVNLCTILGGENIKSEFQPGWKVDFMSHHSASYLWIFQLV